MQKKSQVQNKPQNLLAKTPASSHNFLEAKLKTLHEPYSSVANVNSTHKCPTEHLRVRGVATMKTSEIIDSLNSQPSEGWPAAGVVVAKNLLPKMPAFTLKPSSLPTFRFFFQA